jgi:tetratricopeptide (TPR) repeat protein
MFDTEVTPVVAEHADNDYAQLLEETGIVGGLLVTAFVISIGTLAVRLAIRGRTAASAAAFGLGFGLIAVAIHSATDFGQRLPANFVLSATFCGLVVAISRIEARDRLVRHGKTEASPPDNPKLYRAAAIASLAAVLLIAGWAMKDAYAAFLGERWWAGALAMDDYIQKTPAQADDQDYVDLLASAQGAYESDPTNAIYGYWLNAYRWQAMSRPADPNTRQVSLPPDAVPFVARIADDLMHVRQLCPTYGPPYALEGQLRLFVLGEQAGAELIRKGLRLAPYDAATCLVAGELAARNGDLPQAETLLARAVELRNIYFRDAVAIYLLNVKRPDLARKLAGDEYWRLNELANVCAQNADYADLVEELRTQATVSLRRHAETAAARPYELATLAYLDKQQGELKSAIKLYRRALSQEYNQVDWRLNLAQTLAADGQIAEAEHEARICLRLRPQFAPAVALLEQLSVRLPSK